jgi:uncharacterized alkaline shock family protein YloU
MSTPIGSSTPSSTQSSPQESGRSIGAPAPTSGRGIDPETSQGKTVVADTVVTKIAGMATREVNGVYGFGGGAARALGAVRERIPGARASSSQGVSVEVGERQAAIDLTIVVEYGVAIVELARAIRRNVISAIEQMTGLEVVEVNINVVDLHMATDDESDQAPQPARVQ